MIDTLRQRELDATARHLATETGRLFGDAAANGKPVASYVIDDFDGVWGAVRHFFSAEAKALA